MVDGTLSELTCSAGEYSGVGESMGVVTDILMEELRAEYDQVRNTWIPPEVHAVTLRDLEAATAALKNLEVSRAESERREKSICLRQVCFPCHLTPASKRLRCLE